MTSYCQTGCATLIFNCNIDAWRLEYQSHDKYMLTARDFKSQISSCSALFCGQQDKTLTFWHSNLYNLVHKQNLSIGVSVTIDQIDSQ